MREYIVVTMKGDYMREIIRAVCILSAVFFNRLRKEKLDITFTDSITLYVKQFPFSVVY